MSLQLEIVWMWAAVTLYAAGAALFIISVVFRSPRLGDVAMLATALGVVAHVVGIGGRWVRVGHGPYLGMYEIVSTYALFSVLALLIAVRKVRAVRPIAVAVMPIVFLMLAGAMLASKDGVPITGTLASWWLVVHVAFAKLATGSIVTAFAFSAVYLLRLREGMAERFSKMPRQEVLDDLAFRFVAVGFIFLGIMIAAGAIWANESWGRYWSWDPIETWSLVTWLLYAAILHARLTLGWRDKRFAWAVALALPFALFAFLGVPIVYDSIHAFYLKGTSA